MNCCGSHESHERDNQHQEHHAGGNKANYLLWGLLGLFVLIFALRYFKLL